MTNNNRGCTECKHYLETVNDKLMCTKHNNRLRDVVEDCPDFEELQFCDSCAYSKTNVYETGVIDEIDYRCILQNNKLIYADNNPMRFENAKYPECNIGMYEAGDNV